MEAGISTACALYVTASGPSFRRETLTVAVIEGTGHDAETRQAQGTHTMLDVLE